MTPELGMRLLDRYELREQIAVGGMGEVWRAHDVLLQRPVATKVLRGQYSGQEQFLARLRAEARNTAGLWHPHLATLLDYGEQDGRGYLVMEFVEGEPLSQILAEEGVIPPAEVMSILAQAARGLHAAHVAGVVHRDIKPSNLLITSSGFVKVTDFGISLAAGQQALTAAGMVMGTAQYLPPELAMGGNASPAGDLYALGIVGYEALVGRRPYTGTNEIDIAFAHVNTALPPLPAELPQPLRQLIAQLLAKDPADRPRSAAAVARELDAQLDVSRALPASALAGATHAAGPRPTAGPSAAAATLSASPPSAPPPSLPPSSSPPLASSTTGGQVPAPPSRTATSSRAAPPSRRRRRSQPRWRWPRWRELRADRRWTTAFLAGLVIVIVLAALSLGTLALAGGTSYAAMSGANLCRCDNE